MKKLLFAIIIIFPALLSGLSFARWHTSMGSFTAELYDEIVPITTANFKLLANQGFYNNLIFHRVIDGFVIQDGCPNGTGTGGPGWTIQDEFSPLLHHDQAGILAMARTSAPNSAGSQYYFTLAPTPHLDGNYAIFGKVIEGLEFVLGIGSVPTGANDRPIIPVNIYTLRMLDLEVGVPFPDPATQINATQGEELFFFVEAYTVTADLSFSWYVDDVLQNGANSIVFDTSFTSGGDHTVRCNIASSDSISHDVLWNINSGTANSDAISSLEDFIDLKLFPNPFAENVTLEYSLKETNPSTLNIYNLKGQKVLSRNLPPAKEAAFTWDGKDETGNKLPYGLYILKFNSGNHTVLRKLSLISKG